MAGRPRKAKPPAPAKRPVGRPRHVPTPESQMKVTQLLATGMSQNDVALYLRIDADTLAKRYPQEIRFGRVERRAEVVDLLFAACRKGNVTAIKHVEGMTAVVGAEDAFKRDEPAPRPARLGKKEQAVLEAQAAGAGTDWAGDLGGEPDTGKTAH